jgi:VanZ family protein
MAAIFVQSSFELPAPSRGLPLHADKLIHVVEYAILGWLVRRAIAVGLDLPATPWWIAGALAALYGCTDELHQLFVPGRSGDGADAAADLLGGLLGARLARWREPVSGRGPRGSGAPGG